MKKREPAIAVTFWVEREGILKITLAKSPGFALAIRGEVSIPLEKKIHSWIGEYLEKKNPTQKLPLLTSPLPPFSAAARQALSEVPFGKKITYQDLALLAGRSRAARAAGSVCAKNPHPLVIPCHRVIATDGTLGGFAYGLDIKSLLIAFEN